MNIKNKISSDFKIDTVFILLSSLLLIADYLSIKDIGIYVILLAIISNVQLLFRSKNSLLIINIFLMTYWLALVPFFVYGIHYHIYDTYQTLSLTSQVVLMQIIFQRIITTNETCKKINISNICVKKSKLLFYISIVIAVVFNVYTITVSKSIIGIGYENSFNSGTIFLEYVVVPLSIACIHCSRKVKFQVFSLFVVILISMVLPLLYGKRLPFILCGMIFYIFFLESKLTKKDLVYLVLFSLIFIQIIGVIRDSEYNFSINYLLFGLKENGEYSNNQGGVTAASVAYLGLVKNDTFDLKFRIISFISQFVVSFLPSSLSPDETFINIEAMKYTPIPGNGGFTTTYFYLFLGPIGVIFFSYIFRVMLSIRNHSTFIMLVPILTLTLFPRWMVYSIFPYIKIVVWSLIFYGTLKIFKKIVMK